MVGRLTGTSVRRVEDPRILTGRGRYVDDLRLPGDAPRRVRAQPARPGRHRRDRPRTGPRPRRGAARARRRRAGRGARRRSNRGRRRSCSLLATPPSPVSGVRLVGDPVAVVVASSRRVAEDAAELVEIECEPLPAVTDTDRRRRRRGAAGVRRTGDQRLASRRAPLRRPGRGVRLCRPRRASPLRSAPPCDGPDGMPWRRRRLRSGRRHADLHRHPSVAPRPARPAGRRARPGDPSGARPLRATWAVRSDRRPGSAARTSP